MLPRREFCSALAVYALIGTATAAKAVTSAASINARRWVEAQREIALALAQGRLQPRQWQLEVERLAHGVELRELLRQTDFGRLKRSFDYGDGQPSKRFIRLPDARPELSYAMAFFGFRRGQVITPHGHRNMVSAHMAVAGALHIRTFDRLAETPDGLLLRAAADRRLVPGAVSTMSSQRENVHWFVAEQDDSATLDVIVQGLDPAQEPYTIELVDPLGGSRQSDGSILAPRLQWAQSVSKYAQP